MSEVIVKVFQKDIQKNLFPNNAFTAKAKRDTGVAINAKTVEIPQAGATAVAKENPTNFPLPITQRTDDKKTYDVDLVYVDPVHVEDENQAIVSYDKRKDILSDQIETLKTHNADKAAHIWTPTRKENVIRTSGEAVDTKLAGASGQRKALTLKDWIEARRIAGNMDLGVDGWYALVSENLYAQILIDGLDKFGGTDKLSKDLIAEGIVSKIQGFNIMTRSRVSRFDNEATPVKRALKSTVSDDDNEAIILWHPSYVRIAEGTVKVYQEKDKRAYLGSIFNASVRMGACIPRADEKGVIAIVQSHV